MENIFLLEEDNVTSRVLSYIRGVVASVVDKPIKEVGSGSVIFYLGADSLDSQEIICSVEKDYDVSLPIERDSRFGFLLITPLLIYEKFVAAIKQRFGFTSLEEWSHPSEKNITYEVEKFIKRFQADLPFNGKTKLVEELHFDTKAIADLKSVLTRRFGKSKFDLLEIFTSCKDIEVGDFIHAIKIGFDRQMYYQPYKLVKPRKDL